MAINNITFAVPASGLPMMSGGIQPEDLPEMAIPVLDYLAEERPDVVIACDRGGRLFGVAVHAAWRATHGSEPFPIADGKVHFARVSKSEDRDKVGARIGQIIEQAKLSAGADLDKLDEELLKVLFIDDWIIGGGTKALAVDSASEYGANASFGVMCGQIPRKSA